ncbi:unnamed protein product [Enterobius vermicularis]|uniref:JmjC domain-containing protein n=1 Tax=Enterobius vermicularis TaxID=51028 RepID=A0A0N4VGU1_ENTVE|nr:unnamed protein product [Enterobius vermicularis]
MGMPEAGFSIWDCIRLVGPERRVYVIDVYKQQSYQMSLGSFYKHLVMSDRPRLYNILSMEFSKTDLSEIVTPPSVVSQLSWVERYWDAKGFAEKSNSPLSLEEHINAKPEVSRYCLMGMAGSYTDFHIDFGGSSVWYHVFNGQKIFYVVPPTPANLKLYLDYHQDDSRSEYFFGDKVVLNSGETLLLPSGWIHAVFTPRDSLVFGGNFLHSLSIPMQLRVYEIEMALLTPYRLTFPEFELVNWYAASEMAEQLKGSW